MDTICIYHGNCADGFGSAYVVWRERQKVLIAGRTPEGELSFFPATYNQPPPDVKGKNVIMLDFSYKRDVLDKMIEDCASLLLLDHHKSAKEDLEGVFNNSKVLGEFDMDRSGAMMTWQWFNPVDDPPQLIKHIQDRDLWRFDLDMTREIQAALFSLPYDFDEWAKYMENNLNIISLFNDGQAIERKHHKDVNELLKVTQRRMNIGGHNVPVANLPYTLVSDAAHKMAIDEPFAGCYWDTPRGRVFGLRSTADGLDVSEIALQYGGGGHKAAAGFTVALGWEGEE